MRSPIRREEAEYRAAAGRAVYQVVVSGQGPALLLVPDVLLGFQSTYPLTVGIARAWPGPSSRVHPPGLGNSPRPIPGSVDEAAAVIRDATHPTDGPLLAVGLGLGAMIAARLGADIAVGVDVPIDPATERARLEFAVAITQMRYGSSRSAATVDAFGQPYPASFLDDLWRCAAEPDAALRLVASGAPTRPALDDQAALTMGDELIKCGRRLGYSLAGMAQAERWW